MRSMKGLSMNKMLGSIRRKAGSGRADAGSSDSPPASAATPADKPEVTAHNSVKAFCEAGGNVKTDEVLFLPPIVDAAESSPAAAAECARIIRKYLGKEYNSRPSWQYNAIMLVRILTDNPGETFTRNLDDKFVDTSRALLKGAKDHGVQQILMETLDDFEHTKMYDENLGPLIDMWKSEKDKALKGYGGRVPHIGPRPPVASLAQQQPNRHAQNYFAKAHSNNKLPSSVELAGRLEEARTSAKLLEQVVMNTAPAEILQSDLIREFANRCLSASRSIQGYMASDDPAPDNDTMESLIDTNEQLQTALSQHQRAVLSARKQLPNSNDVSPPPPPPRDAAARGPDVGSATAVSSGAGANGKGKQAEVYGPPDGPPPRVPVPGSGKGRHDNGVSAENPFNDPFTAGSSNTASGGYSGPLDELRLSHEPFDPGFKPAALSYMDGKEADKGTARSGSAGDDDDIYDATPKRKETGKRQ